MHPSNLHTFHIPVMGLAFTIDSPIKVARFGISSVVSIVQDNLIEKMRSYYYPLSGEAYVPITDKEPDYRAKRITDYLNLMNRIVGKQVDELREQPFGKSLEIDQYFEMLPDDHKLKRAYELMQSLDSQEKEQLQAWLRLQIQPGSIDVNIMTKLDKSNFAKDGSEIENGSDAVAAIRGYAHSNLTNSSVVLSAGMNPRLFSYMEGLSAFDADETGLFTKKIIIKVSDYRSALIQGKMLAKKGLWVSEFRIESGLNCGGHAFATDGHLIGTILEEFKNNRQELTTSMFEIYNAAQKAKGKTGYPGPHEQKITFQGGIGTHAEDELITKYYGLESTGWGTPFLLVPEATTVDDHTLQLLAQAEEQDVILSKNSPLGVRFHYLKGTTAEQEKLDRIAKGKPGSPCTEKYLVSNTEFSKEPICTASRTYQKKKIAELQSQDLSREAYDHQVAEVTSKECLCVGLSNAAVKKYDILPFKNREGSNVCPGPNIAYFSEVISLRRMVDHIYGRINVLRRNDRPHMFIKELGLYIDYWKELLTESDALDNSKKKAYIQKFHDNLLGGIAYYRTLFQQLSTNIGNVETNVSDSLDDAENLMRELFHVALGTSSRSRLAP